MFYLYVLDGIRSFNTFLPAHRRVRKHFVVDVFLCCARLEEDRSVGGRRPVLEARAEADTLHL